MRRRVGAWAIVILSTVIFSMIASAWPPPVSAAADDPAKDAAAERERRLEAWRTSPEGRAEVERMTAKSSKLQIHLVLRAGEEGEVDELADPSGQKLRVSREILLNETAFASA